MQPGKDIGDIFICSLDDEAQSFCPTFTDKTCLKQLDCKATLELLIDGNYEELKNFERCFEYNEFSSISYFCPLLESSEPVEATTPIQKDEREDYFAKLKQICGMAGKLSKLFEKESFHSNTFFRM